MDGIESPLIKVRLLTLERRAESTVSFQLPFHPLMIRIFIIQTHRWMYHDFSYHALVEKI